MDSVRMNKLVNSQSAHKIIAWNFGLLQTRLETRADDCNSRRAHVVWPETATLSTVTLWISQLLRVWSCSLEPATNSCPKLIIIIIVLFLWSS